MQKSEGLFGRYRAAADNSNNFFIGLRRMVTRESLELTPTVYLIIHIVGYLSFVVLEAGDKTAFNM